MKPATGLLFGSLLLSCSTALADRHGVFSLVDNRPLGHLQRRGGLYIPAGSAGMAKYTRFGRPPAAWKLRATDDGKKVALVATAATLEVPLTAAQAGANVVHLSMRSPKPSSVKIAAHGKASAAVALKAGWQIVSVPMPAGALSVGENSLGFTFAQSGAAIEMIQVGGTAPTETEGKSAGLLLPKGGGIAYYAYVPKAGGLTLNGDAGGCKVTVRVDGGPEQEAKLDGSSVDLAKHGGKFARVELLADGPSCTAAKITDGQLTTDGAAPARFAANPPKNVIIWLTDDTRSDKYKLYNSKSRVETPVFDELAKSSTLFKVAYTQGNESRVSHASLWTSAYPSVHNMLSDKAKLAPSFVTLAESVRPSGRYTAGVMGNGYIDAFWGFGDGWDSFKNNLHSGGGLKADDLLATARKTLDTPPLKWGAAKNFFLYIGTIDAHVSWRAHEPWLAKYDPEPYNGPFVKACLDPQLDNIVAGKLPITERDKTRIIALYDADVSYNDHVLGLLMSDLQKHGRADDTMLIITSDHGEEFWDHGRIGHGQSLREELVHVPFLIHYPPYFPPGKVVDEGVDVLDVLPTVDDALGVAPPEGAQGESLVPLAAGIGAGYPRPSIASQYELAWAMRLDRYKIWVGGRGDVQLYDAASDAHEDHELSKDHPTERRALTDALGTFLAFRNQWKKKKWGVASNLLPGFAAEMEK
jgi:arylsulfatase A-like enzyme